MLWEEFRLELIKIHIFGLVLLGISILLSYYCLTGRIYRNRKKIISNKIARFIIGTIGLVVILSCLSYINIPIFLDTFFTKQPSIIIDTVENVRVYPPPAYFIYQSILLQKQKRSYYLVFTAKAVGTRGTQIKLFYLPRSRFIVKVEELNKVK